jgi:hypothetical protein
LAELEASKNKIAVQQFLENVLEEIGSSQKLENVAVLTKDLHVWPGPNVIKQFTAVIYECL